MERLFRKLNRYFHGGWRLAVLDTEKGRWIVEPAVSNIGYLRAENANGRHILMQPTEESRYLLADDLSWPVVCRHHQRVDGTWKPGRMVIETSPRNYQVWIHSRRFLSLTEKRYWLRRLMSDPGADPDNRWGRCPGFRNRKEKHRDCSGHYPLSRLTWIDWTGPVEIPHTALEFAVPTSSPLTHQPHGGGVCRQHLSRSDYDCGDESATDFSYALALARRGYAPSEIRRCLLSERSNWHNHRGPTRIDRYLDRTIRSVMALIEKTYKLGANPNPHAEDCTRANVLPSHSIQTNRKINQRSTLIRKDQSS